MDDIKQQELEELRGLVGGQLMAELAHERARAAVYEMALKHIVEPTYLTTIEPHVVAAIALEAVKLVRGMCP